MRHGARAQAAEAREVAQARRELEQALALPHAAWSAEHVASRRRSCALLRE